jgi:hypothetical protein
MSVSCGSLARLMFHLLVGRPQNVPDSVGLANGRGQGGSSDSLLSCPRHLRHEGIVHTASASAPTGAKFPRSQEIRLLGSTTPVAERLGHAKMNRIFKSQAQLAKYLTHALKAS